MVIVYCWLFVCPCVGRGCVWVCCCGGGIFGNSVKHKIVSLRDLNDRNSTVGLLSVCMYVCVCVRACVCMCVFQRPQGWWLPEIRFKLFALLFGSSLH